MANCNSKNDIREKVLAYVSKQCSGNWEAFAERTEDALVNQYMSVLSERLVKVLTRDIDFVLPTTGIPKPVASHLAIASPPEFLDLRRADWGEFIDWVKTVLDREVLKEQSERWYLHERKRLLREFRTALKHVRVRQEFVENLDQSGRVSLVLFKDDTLASIQNVSPDKLKWLGWKRDSPTESYWRYSEGKAAELFKVQMDGEVVGIWDADGDINWDEGM
ncbi:hypothetical protein PVAG01_05856 [Phlyctema vagabunda]|uniref:Uncharacterized protein n=1 Tax=Phlyctema vagabunda TaxID=108571 RepID=A0ABR4PEI2_9HELO